MYNTIEECQADPKLKYLKELLCNTGIHGGLIEYEKDKGFVDSGIYFVASAAPIPDVGLNSKSPADVQRKIEGDPSSFYPYEFAVKITDEDPLVVFDKASEFCHRAEMIKVYFGLEDVKIPEEMQTAEVEELRMAVANSRNNKISGAMRECVRKDMKKAIKTYGAGPKKSDKQTIADYVRENKQINYETIDEKNVPDFVDFLRKRDPNLEYVLSNKISVKTGLEETKKGEYDPYGVVGRNYEYREVYFKRADEQIFEDAFNYIQFSQTYGRGHDITVAALSSMGPVCSVRIPENYMGIVDSCFNKWGVEYAIDYGYLNKTDGRTVPILYLEKNKNIIEGMTQDLCSRFANESYVQGCDKCTYNDKMRAQENKRLRGREKEER